MRASISAGTVARKPLFSATRISAGLPTKSRAKSPKKTISTDLSSPEATTDSFNLKQNM
jgi:hypothetical protein